MNYVYGPSWQEQNHIDESKRAARNHAIAELCAKRQRLGWNVKLVADQCYGYRIEHIATIAQMQPEGEPNAG